MISGACNVDYEMGPESAHEVMGCIQNAVENLNDFLNDETINECSLLGYINSEIFIKYDFCAFCKGGIHKVENYPDKVILYTTDIDAVRYIKEYTESPVLIVVKPYKHPEDEEIDKYFIVIFEYWDCLFHDNLKKWIFESFRNTLELAEDWEI